MSPAKKMKTDEDHSYASSGYEISFTTEENPFSPAAPLPSSVSVGGPTTSMTASVDDANSFTRTRTDQHRNGNYHHGRNRRSSHGGGGGRSRHSSGHQSHRRSGSRDSANDRSNDSSSNHRSRDSSNHTTKVSLARTKKTSNSGVGGGVSPISPTNTAGSSGSSSSGGSRGGGAGGVGGGGGSSSGPVDLDDLFHYYNIGVDVDDQSLLSEDSGGSDGDDEDPFHTAEMNEGRFFNNPNKRLLDNDASLIPGSPFSKPANTAKSNRPAEPLAIAKWASTLSFAVTIGWVGFLFFAAIWNYSNIGRIIVECILALLSFFGLFWNSYFIISSIFKCFIPVQAFTTNTKYCSIIPETKPPGAEWLDVTIQIPVYKESLQEVMMPTLKSCLKARDHYIKNTGANCNIVLCDDGMMAFLRDNFPAAEMLWDSIQETGGRIIQLRKLLNRVPRASRRHLKGLRSKSVYEVFHRMLFYYHFKIGFVARSTVDRRGKFKKASNLNSHLRLALGASQLAETEEGLSYEEALMMESHNDDGSRFVMFGNDIKLGHLICVNDADARMAESVIFKTVPEFLHDKTLGFTQHATKTMNEQRGESYFTNMLTVYTDALYQGHFLLSSILGCHPPLVGHSIFLRTEAVKQCGRMRMMRKAQRWLRNIGLPFLPVDQIGFSNLQAENRIEYWSESHVSEDFELMIHLYNLGFNGRYCAYPDCEFQEGITRTFDEEAGRHRKFALGAHELCFNPFAEMFGHGVFTPLFKTFLTCDIPSYYKIFLTAYLCSYTTGGAYIIIFTTAAVARILDTDQELHGLMLFSPAGIIILNIIIYYIIGYATILVSLCRMHLINNKLLFPEYRKKWCGPCYIIFVMLRYCLVFQFLFYSVATFSFYFLGSMDHLLSRPNICGATNKDSINISRCEAFWDMAKFNSGSWLLAVLMLGLAYATVLQEEDWNYLAYPDTIADIVDHALFAGPAALLAIMSIVNPILLNPFVLGWPFLRRPKPAKKKKNGGGGASSAKDIAKDPLGRVVELRTFIDKAEQLNSEIERVQGKPDIELGSLATREIASHGVLTAGGASPNTSSRSVRKTLDRLAMEKARQQEAAASRKARCNSLATDYSGSLNDSLSRMYAIPEKHGHNGGADHNRSQVRFAPGAPAYEGERIENKMSV